jgi:hypothetical protein
MAGSVAVTRFDAVLPGALVVAVIQRFEGYRFVVAGVTGSAAESSDGMMSRSFIAG